MHRVLERIGRVMPALVIGLAMASPGPALAALEPELLDDVTAAVREPTPEASALALRSIFASRPADVFDVAVEATRISPSSCGVIMREAATAQPDLAVDVAAGIIDAAPECETEVTGILTEFLEAAAGAEAVGLGIPAPDAFTNVTTNAENPSQDTASPTLP